MHTHRFGRNLKLSSTIAIKHQIRKLMFEDLVKKAEAGAAEAIRGQLREETRPLGIGLRRRSGRFASETAQPSQQRRRLTSAPACQQSRQGPYGPRTDAMRHGPELEIGHKGTSKNSSRQVAANLSR
jgi:hypothetical protein